MPDNMPRTGLRDRNGRFLKGTTGNPGGRPKEDRAVVELARQHTEAAVAALVETVRDPGHPQRIRAAEALLDRGWGRPRQAIDADIQMGFDPEDARRRLLERIERREKTSVDDDEWRDL